MKLIDMESIAMITLFIITTYGFGLFWWYWDKKGKATEAYIYVMGLYANCAFLMACGLYANYIHFYKGYEAYQDLLASHIWGLRLLPLAITFVVITGRLTVRACRMRRYAKKQYERRRKCIDTREGKK